MKQDFLFCIENYGKDCRLKKIKGLKEGEKEKHFLRFD